MILCDKKDSAHVFLRKNEKSSGNAGKSECGKVTLPEFGLGFNRGTEVQKKK
jgi:hypothetical protein